MPEGWTRATLSEVCEKPQYGLIASSSDRPVGPRFIRQTDIITGAVDWTTVPFCQATPQEIKKYGVSVGDLLISRLGAGVGTAARIREHRGAVFAGYLVRFRPDPKVLDDVFAGQLLQSRPWKDHVARVRSGAAQPTLNARQMGEFEFDLPPIDMQRRISAVLGALDELIECNERLATASAALREAVVLEALANADGECPLSSLATFVNGRNFTKGASGRGRPVIRTPEMRRGPAEATVFSDVEAADDFLARLGDVLFVWSGSLMVGRWLWGDGLVNQHIFKVIPAPGVPAWLVYALIGHQMDWFLGLAADKATTMGHIQRMHLDAPVPSLASSEVDRLTPLVQPLWDQELQAIVEAQDLRRVRNELLPLLLSGEVSASEGAA